MFRPRYLLLNLFLIYFVSAKSDAYRILGVFPQNLKSNNYVFEGAMKALAKRGHQVDVVTHFKLKNPPENYRTIINLSGSFTHAARYLTIQKIEAVKDQDMAYNLLLDHGNKFCNQIKDLVVIRNLLLHEIRYSPYQAIITDASAVKCLKQIGCCWKVPLIAIISSFDLSWTGENLITRSCPANFFDVIFFNSYHRFYGHQTPLIEIGGIQVEQNDAKLNPQLQKWMDESTDGIIYFSMGSMLLIESLPKETLLTIYSSFAKLAPIRILMKIINKGKLPPGLPENVLTLPWIPQIPVLKHNNTRLFITHGGINSVIEALYYGVPMLGVAVSQYEFMSVDILTRKNMGLRMNYKRLSEKSLDKALNSLLYNRTFRDAARRESQLFLNKRQMNASHTVVAWVEHSIRVRASFRLFQAPIVEVSYLDFSFERFGYSILFCTIITTCVFAFHKLRMLRNLRLFSEERRDFSSSSRQLLQYGQ